MNAHLSVSYVLADTETLLASGGDERIALDSTSGLSPYGCTITPTPSLVALGSSTASVISQQGFEAADQLRMRCAERLLNENAADVYADEMDSVRNELLRLCHLPNDGSVSAIMAASGTDLHLLVAQWLRPSRIVAIAPAETGSGIPSALQGRHYNTLSAYGGKVSTGAALNDWHGELMTVEPRTMSGELRDAAQVNADYVRHVEAATSQGHSVLLILSDVSKTGLIAPSVDTILALRSRWPTLVDVLVDACQFRVAANTIRRYIELGLMVAVTGSKFISGPTFSGALLAGRTASEKLQRGVLQHQTTAYTCAADWPRGWPTPDDLPQSSNFGLLLRWQAALTELRRFDAIPETTLLHYVREFADAVSARLSAEGFFEALPVTVIARTALGRSESWDCEQTIFPFILHTVDADGKRRVLNRSETVAIYHQLRFPKADSLSPSYQVGQPVACGERDGIPISALRLCLSARMLADAAARNSIAHDIANAHAALDTLADALAAM